MHFGDYDKLLCGIEWNGYFDKEANIFYMLNMKIPC